MLNPIGKAYMCFASIFSCSGSRKNRYMVVKTQSWIECFNSISSSSVFPKHELSKFMKIWNYWKFFNTLFGPIHRWKSKTWVMCQLQVQICKLGVQIYALQFQIHELKFQSTSYKLKSTNYEFKSRSYKFKSTWFTNSNPWVKRVERIKAWIARLKALVGRLKV